MSVYRFDEVPPVLVRRAGRVALRGGLVLLLSLIPLAVIWWCLPGMVERMLLLYVFLGASVWALFHLRMRDRRRFLQAVREARYRVCPVCGYSLAGLAETGNCPECGVPYEREALRAWWELAAKPMFERSRGRSG